MLRIAVPNKGSLAETAAEMLSEAGYTGRRDSKDLYTVDPVNEVEFFYLRPRDIATYVGSGALDVGITGRDLLLDARMPGAREVESLGFAGSTFRFAGRPGRFTDVQDVADAVADVVSTGTTLRQAGLEIFGPVLLESDAVLIAGPQEAPGTETLLRRLRGVLAARKYVLVDYDLPAHLVEQAIAVAPGLESPTISPLRDPEWVAVRVMSPRRDVNRVMDELYAIGARAILVTEILAARL
ncbi:MAG: phosphoribosyltransferase [Microbacterium sp.]|nr:phosphoribosyltransferase [Microbacterium sp.]